MASVTKQVLLMKGSGPGYPPITGLIGWWDVSQFSSLTLSGANVTNMADLSGAGNHLGDGSGSNKPQYSAAGPFNTTYPSLKFNAGSSQILQQTASAFPMGTGNSLTYFYVGTVNSASAGFARALSYAALGHPNDYDNTMSWRAGRNSASPQVVFERNSIAGPIVGVAYSTPIRVIGTVSAVGAQTLILNGTPTAGTTINQPWVSGGVFHLGGFGTAFWDGYIVEAGVSTAFTNATDVTTLDLWLKAKWGL